MKQISILLLSILACVGCQSTKSNTRRDAALQQRAAIEILQSCPEAAEWVREHRQEIIQTALSVAVVAANLDR